MPATNAKRFAPSYLIGHSKRPTAKIKTDPRRSASYGKRSVSATGVCVRKRKWLSLTAPYGEGRTKQGLHKKGMTTSDVERSLAVPLYTKSREGGGASPAG
jgi:hypothetical protein